MPNKYFKPALPDALKERIMKLIKEHPEVGYNSVSGFVTDATRRRLEEIDRQLNGE